MWVRGAGARRGVDSTPSTAFVLVVRQGQSGAASEQLSQRDWPEARRTQHLTCLAEQRSLGRIAVVELSDTRDLRAVEGDPTARP